MSGVPPASVLQRAIAPAALPAPFDERAMHPVRATLPIGPSRLAHVAHIAPDFGAAGPSPRGPRNTADQDAGGQSGYIIAPGPATGDGSIYVAMTAYDDAWVTTPTDGSYNTVNAPTTHGPNGNCIETVTNYYNGFGTPGTTVDQIQFYDFCANNGQGAFVGALPIDATFVRDYVRTYTDPVRPLPRYVSAVVHSASDNRWHAYLYNASLMTYVDYYDSAPGANAQVLSDEGWSIFETHYNGGACTTLPDVSEEAIQVRTSLGWQLLSAGNVQSYASGTCFSAPLNPPYYVPAFASSPGVAWTVTSYVAAGQSEYARVVNADAPLAYYRLGDSGGTAADSSGGGLTGTYGANVTRDAQSLLAVEASNGAARFPGGTSTAAGMISVPAAARLQPQHTFSLETWIDIARPVIGTTDIVSYGPEAAGQAYTLQLLPNGTLGAYVTMTSGGFAAVTGKTVLATGEPYLVDATYDGAQLRLYVNGVLDAAANASGSLNYGHVTAATGLAIGSAFDTKRTAFTGVLDEVAVFGTALSAARVGAHYTAGSGLGVAPAVSTFAATVAADAPLAFYRLSDASTTAADATAHHLNATYGANVVRNVPGLVATDAANNAARFPGGASSPAVAVSAPRAAALEPPSGVSLEAWVEPSARATGTVDLVSYGGEQLGQPYTLQLLAGGTIAMYVSTSHGFGFVNGRTPLSLSVPHLVDATYDGKSLDVYVDGSLDASAAASGTLDYSHETAADGLSIGTAFDTPRSAFAGIIGDVSLYAGPLTAQRIAAHWAAGSDRIAGP